MSLDNMENSASKRVGDDVENEKRSKKRKRNADTSHEKDGQSQHIHDRRRPSKEGHPQPVQKLVQKSAQHGKSKGKQLSSQIGSKQNAGPSSQLTRVRDALLPIRKALPIWSKASAIRDTLRKSNVLVLTGETGSGKSTQVPQFLVDEPWCTKCIAITQPRRVAATSLARRVAQEMGSPLGNKSPAARVGYAVRFDSSFGPNTKIKYVTDGMLLQEMLGDSSLSQYSAIVVDEVHERSVNVDLILGFLRNMVRNVAKNAGAARKHPLKVVIMSATADVESLVEFFGNSDVETPVNASKDLLSESDARAVSTCFVEGRQFPVKTVYLPSPTQDWIESAQKLIFEINFKEALPGDILVFLAGKDNIDELEKLVNDLAKDMDKNLPKLLVLPLHAQLPYEAQQLIFQPTPHRTRKVILATNIAETSITVPGVRFVIDSGKSKIKQYRAGIGIETLLAKPISKAAAIQRQGRAGREGPGQCYRLYTEESYKGMEDRTKPEILRSDLSKSILTMKARGIDDVFHFPFLDKPSDEALLKAMNQLVQLQATNEYGEINETGLKIAKLPLTPAYGRVLIEAAKSELEYLLLDVIDIISALTIEGIFLNLVNEERKLEAEQARRDLYRREGDHLTLLATVQSYAGEKGDRKIWSQKHFVSHQAMQSVMKTRKQLRVQCVQLGLLPDCETDSDLPLSEARSRAILTCMLRGFIPNTARLMPDGSYKTYISSQTVSIHPSSVLFGRKVEAIVFNEFVYTGKAWAKSVSAVEQVWIQEIADTLYGSDS